MNKRSTSVGWPVPVASDDDAGTGHPAEIFRKPYIQIRFQFGHIRVTLFFFLFFRLLWVKWNPIHWRGPFVPRLDLRAAMWFSTEELDNGRFGRDCSKSNYCLRRITGWLAGLGSRWIGKYRFWSFLTPTWSNCSVNRVASCRSRFSYGVRVQILFLWYISVTSDA